MNVVCVSESWKQLISGINPTSYVRLVNSDADFLVKYGAFFFSGVSSVLEVINLIRDTVGMDIKKFKLWIDMLLKTNPFYLTQHLLV